MSLNELELVAGTCLDCQTQNCLESHDANGIRIIECWWCHASYSGDDNPYILKHDIKSLYDADKYVVKYADEGKE